MPQWPVDEIRKSTPKAVVGLAYCRLAATTTNPSWKMRYQYSAGTALNQALRVASRVRLEYEREIYDEFVAAATLLQRSLAKLNAEANSPTESRETQDTPYNPLS